MIFSSITFFIFFAIVLLLMIIMQSAFFKRYFTEKNIRNAKHFILLISSYIFYGWWDWRFCILMFIMTFIAYYCARKIEAEKHVKWYKIIGIIVPLITLGIFKYFNFFVESFYNFFKIEGFKTANIILPVGISFYTFQSMSYTIDVIKKRIKSHNLMEVALYISFFPQLVAGPIVKAADFIPQLSENREITSKNFLRGIQIFVFGLFKKIVIADHLSVFVDDAFANPVAFSSLSLALAVVAYSIQIYFDFSGYSDMAIGAAKCLGYDFNRNFNIPYISKNVSEFWKRWHISLSSWLQEYLYIPLGGNRKGRTRTYVNLLITMILGGLWHGANVTFIIWGALHGLALCIHKIYKEYIGKNRKSTTLGTVFSILITYIFVCICWIFFRAQNVSNAFTIIHKIFIWQDGIMQIYSWAVIAIIIVAIAEIIAYIRSRRKNESSVNGFYMVMDLNKFTSLVILFVFIGIILGTAFTDSNPFIYFQF